MSGDDHPRARTGLVPVPVGDRAVGDRERDQHAVPRPRRRRVPAVRAGGRGRSHSPASLAGADRPAALRRGRDRRAAPVQVPRPPVGGHRRRRLHADRLADPHLDIGPHLPDPDRRRHPRPAPAAVRTVHGGRPDGVLAGNGAGLAPRGRRRPAGRRRPRPPRGAGPRPGDVTAPPPGRRTSPRIVLVHTATFRQARQFVPVLIPLVAATGFGGGRTTIILLVLG